MNSTALAAFTADETVAEIFADYALRYPSSHRTYLGGSAIGDPCARRLWLKFRWVQIEQFEGRMLRLFQTGHLAEPRFVEDLRNVGIEVLDVDPSTGRQFAVSFLGGHLRGHADGAALGIKDAEKTWHLLEFKTHSAKSFATLQAKGVQEAKPQHWAQMQLYMHGLELTRAYYLAVNKNTDELYGERIHYDKDAAETLVDRGRRIIFASEPPAPISDRPDWYECKMCSLHQFCHKADHRQELPEVNCRTCIHSTPTEDGGWVCEQSKKALSVADQREGCHLHLWMPSLFPSLEYTHADESGDGTITAVHYTGPAGAVVNDHAGRMQPWF